MTVIESDLVTLNNTLSSDISSISSSIEFLATDVDHFFEAVSKWTLDASSPKRPSLRPLSPSSRLLAAKSAIPSAEVLVDQEMSRKRSQNNKKSSVPALSTSKQEALLLWRLQKQEQRLMEAEDLARREVENKILEQSKIKQRRMELKRVLKKKKAVKVQSIVDIRGQKVNKSQENSYN
ncbi:hypothetical protein GEMRC1_004138 [Eukaryota sp. GEM-RC1]